MEDMYSSKFWSERGRPIVQLLTLCEMRELGSNFVLQAVVGKNQLLMCKAIFSPYENQRFTSKVIDLCPPLATGECPLSSPKFFAEGGCLHCSAFNSSARRRFLDSLPSSQGTRTTGTKSSGSLALRGEEVLY
jgi:hypothetical protein